jgi:sugar phosphate permease
MFNLKINMFYGYWVLSAGSLVMVVLGIAGLHGLGVFFSALQRDYMWSSALLSGAFALSRAESAFLGPVEGVLVDKFGPRKMIALGLAILGLGFILLSRVDSLLSFYLALITIALGTGIGGFLAVMSLLTNWFEKFRARSMAIATIGVNVGGLMVVALTWSVSSFGWRSTALFLAIIIFMLIIPITKIVRDRPEDYGLLPDGTKPKDIESYTEKTIEQESNNEDITVKEAIRSQAFWVISLVHGIAVMALSALAVHQIERMVQVGISMEMAGLVVSVYTGFGIFFRILSGYLADKIDKRYVIAVFLVFQTLSLLVFAFGNSVFSFMIFGLLFAPGWSGRGAALTAYRGELFGRKRFASITGLSMVITNALSLTGPIFTGVLFDSTGSYESPFVIMAGLSLVAGVLILFTKKPNPKSRINSPD